MNVKRTVLTSFLFLYFFSVLPGCSFPRIIVLNDPLTAQEHLALGVSYEKEREYEAALKEYRLAADRLPVAHVYMGNVHFTRGETANAEKHYLLALEKDPQNADACNNLAWLYLTSGGNLEDAYRLALHALKLNPSKSEIYRDTIERIKEKMERQKGS